MTLQEKDNLDTLISYYC